MFGNNLQLALSRPAHTALCISVAHAWCLLYEFSLGSFFFNAFDVHSDSSDYVISCDFVYSPLGFIMGLTWIGSLFPNTFLNKVP